MDEVTRFKIALAGLIAAASVMHERVGRQETADNAIAITNEIFRAFMKPKKK